MTTSPEGSAAPDNGTASEDGTAPKNDIAPEEALASDVTAPKPQRPATLIFTQTVLSLQAFAVLFATLVTWGLSRTELVNAPVGAIWGVGTAVMLAMLYVAGKQKERWGRIAGWILQAPMLLAGLIEPAIAVIGAMFLGLWIMGLRLGGRIDRERAERIEAERIKAGE